MGFEYQDPLSRSYRGNGMLKYIKSIAKFLINGIISLVCVVVMLTMAIALICILLGF